MTSRAGIVGRADPEQGFGARQLAERLQSSYSGPDVFITTLCQPAAPHASGVAVVDGNKAARTLASAMTKGAVGLVVAPEGLDLDVEAPVIRVHDARLAFARLTQIFDARPVPKWGISNGAHVADGAVLAAGVSVGPGAVIESGVHIGKNAVIGANSAIGANARIGADTVLYAGVCVYDGVRIGERVKLHSGVVIGADGFGYARSPAGAVKIHQLGAVVIEDEVEVGANTAIDRGTLDDTRIGARTKIDNLCQVGHNVVIGRDCIIAGMTAIGGSTTLADRVTVGGGVKITDHVHIGEAAIIAGGAGISKNVPPGETWIGTPAEPHRRWIRTRFLIGRLEKIWRIVRSQTPS